MSAPVVVPPTCPAWCEVTSDEHQTDVEDSGNETYIHHRDRRLANEYAGRPRADREWAPRVSVAANQPVRGGAVVVGWIHIEADTYLTLAEARALAAELSADADRLADIEGAA